MQVCRVKASQRQSIAGSKHLNGDVSIVASTENPDVTVNAGEMMNSIQIPEHLQLTRNIPFNRYGMSIDLLEPKEISSSPRPVIIYIHDGSFEMFEKSASHNIFLAEAGFLVVSIDYRMRPAFQFSVQMHDCKAAVRWIRAHAEPLYIDPDRIGVWGIRAGAHLAALLGTTPDHPDLEGGEVEWENHSSGVQAVVNISGITDFFDPGCPINMVKILGGSADPPHIAHLASPVQHASVGSAAFLHLHGERDREVWPSQAIRLHRALLQAGASSELQWLEGDHQICETHRELLEVSILQFFQTWLMPPRAVALDLCRNAAGGHGIFNRVLLDF